MTEYYTLDRSKKYKSKTQPVPFLVAHECCKTYKDKVTGEPKDKNREYFAFDDIHHFLEMRDKFPHSHEIVWDRYVPNKQQGRLVFDFDFTSPWYGLKPNWVSPDFQSKMEGMIIKVFKTYYFDVDTNKFCFVWLTSDTVNKWSKHLVVKNAFFSNDWKEQGLVFYNLLLAMINDEKPFECSTDLIIDEQVIRTNATMRMVGCSKMQGNILTIDEPEKYDFFDTLIQLYRGEEVKTEQNIEINQLNKKLLEQKNDENSDFVTRNEYYKQAFKYSGIDLSVQFEGNGIEITEEEGRMAFEIFDEKFPGMFKFKNVTGSIINMDRLKSAACPLSKKIHDNENAFLVVGQYNNVSFCCRRGCKKDDRKLLKIC
tara:strand:- start:170 stop:1279 length:1110 start_codon:yes stop_codon:yes gene_type:complete